VSQVGPLFSTYGFSDIGVNDSVAAGRQTIGARVLSLGGANDAQVIVEWFPLIHGRASDGTSMPRWDGSDLWAIDARLAYDPANPGSVLIRSDTGYTTCGTLVARLPARVPIRFTGNMRSLRLTLTGSVMVGAIDPMGHSLGPLDFSAWWNVQDALTDIGVFGICPPTDGGTSPMWNLASQVLTGSADLLSTGESSPPVQCDAISAAFRVEFVPIDLGPDEMSPNVPEDLCGR
jgi:hypothetical protein